VSYRRRLVSFAIFILSLLLLPACYRKAPEGGKRRLALVRFENLSSDPKLDWLARAIPGTLAIQLGASPEYAAFLADNDRDVRAGLASLELVGYYTLVGGRLQITAHIRVPADAATARTIEIAGDPNTDPLSLIDSLARKISSQVQPLPTRSVEAARAFWSSGDASSGEEAAARLEAAIQADPAFAAAYLSAIEAAVQRRDTAAADKLIAMANAAAPSFDELSRARLRLLESNVKGDAAGRVRALTELARLSPADAGVWRELGTLELGQRNYAAAADALARAHQITPDDILVLNLAGYAKAFSGDAAGARATLEEYSRQAPKDANALDSMGDVSFYFGRFDQAAKDYQQAHQLNPSLLGGGDLYRAALALYFGGHPAEADALFASCLQYRAANGDQIGAVREAVWEASTGRLDRARLRLRNYLERTDIAPESRSISASQLAIFDLAAGKQAHFEAPPSASPAGQTLRFYATFLTQPDAGAEAWKGRTDALAKLGQPLLVKQLLGYALVLHGHFAAAVPVFQEVLAELRPEIDSDARIMLAWASAGAGHAAESRKLLERYPIPPHMAEPGLTFLTLAKCREVRK